VPSHGATKPSGPRHARGERIKVVCGEPATGKKKAKFQADDGFPGHVSEGAQPKIGRGEEIELWVANVSSQGYTLSTTEPAVKQHQPPKRPGPHKK
jgi:hypothetical protein